MRTHSANNRIGPEVAVGELFCGPGCIDIQGIQEDFFADLKLGSWGSTLVIVPCHIILRLREGGTSFIQHQFHLIGELVHGLDL
jgi:hypothetical protein